MRRREFMAAGVSIACLAMSFAAPAQQTANKVHTEVME